MKRKAHFQRTFAAQTSFEKYGRKSKREQFLDQMNEVVPWSRLLSLVEPHYPKAGNGRRPVGLEIMLRAYFVQQWFNLSDPGMEDALYDSASLRHFVGVDLGTAAAPDETTILRFRHLLEDHDLGGAMLDEVNHHLGAKGIRITTGTIVDATIIHAPSSTKNSSGERDPEMHQTKKGNQWYFGLKAHIGVDSKQGVVHSVCTSSGQCGRQPDACGPVTWRGTQGVGRRRLSRTGRCYPRGCSARSGHDLPPNQVQELCGRRGQAQEHDQVQSPSESGTSLPDTEAHLRLR
jgi:IS5 family transposase